MKPMVVALVAVCVAGPARAACDFASIDGHQKNQWTVRIEVADGRYSQTLDTDKSQVKSGTATIACDGDSVTIRQTSATAGKLCAYDLKRDGISVKGTYTCENDTGGPRTFSGIIAK